jgi:hypothetical protein
MGRVLSLVLTAMCLWLTHSWKPGQAWGGWVAQRDGVPCCIEDLVALSRGRRPATSTLRSTRLVGTGEVG